MPNISEDYDVIGMSADHCLVKYNVTELAKLIISAHLDELHSLFGYSEEILNFDYENNLGVCLNNVVWDIKHGTIL